MTDEATPEPEETAVTLSPGRHFTNSELKQFKRCRRKWWLGSYRQLRWMYEPRTGPLQIGTRLHTWMETYFNAGVDAAWDQLHEQVAGDCELYPEDADQIIKDADLVSAMAEGYIEWSEENGSDEDYDILANEIMVEVPMPGMEAVYLLGKLDQLVLKRSTREVFFRDWKTVADFSRTRLLINDEQMLHYMLLLRMLANQPGDVLTAEQREYATAAVGAVYAQFRKVKRTARAKPPFYQHTIVRHNAETVGAYFDRVWEEIVDVLTLEAKLQAGGNARALAYPNPTRDCSWDCQFQTVCHMFDDGSDVESVLAAQYETVSPLERYASEVKGASE